MRAGSGCFMLANLAYNKTKKRGSRERSPPPCQIRTLILPRCPKARGNIDLDLNIDPKVLRTLRPRGATLTDHVCAPSNGIQAAVYDSIGPTIGAHDRSIAVPVGSPTLKPSAQKPGRVCRPRDRNWPPAAILQLAPKWWASPEEESSQKSIKVVEKLSQPDGRPW